MRISDWSSDVCSSDLPEDAVQAAPRVRARVRRGCRVVTGEMVEKACRARISAQWGRPVEDHEWAAVRSGVAEKWMAEALAAVLPDHRKQVIEEAATAVERQDSRQFPGRGWASQYAAALPKKGRRARGEKVGQ